MGDYRHCYSDYITHILNKSPSKTAYSFSRSQRFPHTTIPEYVPNVQASSHLHPLRHTSNFQNSRKSLNKSKSRGRYDESRARSPSKMGVNYELQKIIRSIEQRNSRSKSSKNKYSPSKNQKYPGKISPTKKIRRFKENSPSPSPKARSPSPKTKSPTRQNFYKQLKTLDHPSQNITVTGYYPVGIQLSPTGKYASSRYKNIVGTKFSPEVHRKQYGTHSFQCQQPGYYPKFSEFGS